VGIQLDRTSGPLFAGAGSPGCAREESSCRAAAALTIDCDLLVIKQEPLVLPFRGRTGVDATRFKLGDDEMLRICVIVYI
jgi:hypothetical protein